jgi:type I restriction-modification system DNA methylase subunit
MSSEIIQLDKYISRARQANTHPAKLVVLSEMLREIFGVELEDLLPGIEKKIGSKILGIKGRIDLLYSDIVFEIKVDLDRELENAKRELKKYFQALIENDPNRKYVGIATDVIKYKAFIPVVENNKVIDVKEISSIDLSEISVVEAILWLDSYIFSKPKIRPTANDLKFRFGPGSPTYAVAIEMLGSLWDLVKEEEDVKLRYELWSRNMEIVYGSKPDVKTFIDQTYLVTLVKLITYLRLSGDTTATSAKMLKALKGEFFTEYEIMNLIEEDYFTWILHEKIRNQSLELVSTIAKELLRYDLSQIDEDFFKEIYEEIVERGQRHRVGEYYTPEWLTELTLKEVLDIWWRGHDEPPKILDPACGSGTFLSNAIHMLKDELIQRGWSSDKILDYILTSIVGIDINPLAVTIARANYLIALGELLHVRKGSILIPIYVADSIKLPNVTVYLFANMRVYLYKVNDINLYMPVDIAKDRSKVNRVITAFKDSIESYRARRNKDEAITVFRRALQNIVSDAEFMVLKSTLDGILSLIDRGKDSIWIYMLSNVYMPVTLSESKFDIIVGNPPWIAFRYIENKEYQDFVKEKFISYELLRSDQVKLFTQIELATLFFCMVSDLYLKDGGIIGFVMPRSILTGALHHAEFKKFKKPTMTLHKILDLENVSPLFNVPTCVLIASKGGKTSYPVLARKISGKLPAKNIKLNEALKYIKAEDYEYQPPQILQGKSPYHDLVKAGASIYPRSFYFVELVIHPTLGIDLKRPYCRTSQAVLKNAKEPWKSVTIEGKVEKEFIYATVLGDDLLPFNCSYKLVVLPAKPVSMGLRYKFKLLDVDELRKEGYIFIANWLEKAQKIWEEKATRRMLSEYPRLVSYIDYMGLLSSQDPGKRYVVIYNAIGSNIVSCVVDRQGLPPFYIGNIILSPQGFVAEKTTIFYETDNELEAHYLSAILNSDIINDAIKPLQPKGMFGERAIHRRPFMFPIPRFDPNNPIHRRLAELSKICHAKASRVAVAGKSVANRRKRVREVLESEIAKINELVSQLLGLG